MDVLLILWLLIGLYVSGLSVFSLRLFSSDHDKRKLIFGLGLLFSSISFYLLGFGYETYGPTTYFTSLLYHWGPTAYSILIFYVQFELLFGKKINVDLIFKLFLITLLSSFLIIASQIITPFLYGVFMSFGTLIALMFSFRLIVRDRNISSFLFMLSLVSILTASYLLTQIDESTTILSYFSLFSFFIGYTFIGIIFLVSPLESTNRFGIGSYFSFEQKLEETKKELQDSRQAFHDLFNQMIDGVVIVNKKGTIIEASQKIFDDLGISRGELIDKNFLKTPFFDAKTKKTLIKKVFLLLAGNHMPPFELTAINNEGVQIPYEIHAGKIRYNGKTAIMGVIRDLRERKKAEKSLHDVEIKYKTIFEKTGTAIGIFNDDSIITMVNTKFETLTGYSKDEVEHKLHWYDFIHDKQRKRMFEYHKQRSQKTGNPPMEYTSSLVDKKGSIKHIQINIGMIPETSLRVVSLIDITPLKEMQSQLERINKDLELEVNERTKKIQELLKQKDDFINQLGHDLKNPLGPLINLMPILEKRENNPKYQEMFQVLNRNINYMKNLVVKTIKLAKLNSPNTEFHMQETDLNEVVEEVISANSLLFEGKSITVTNNISSQLILDVDALQIQELFLNLLTNAAKYSEPHGKISIDASLYNDKAVFSVKDTGAGMSEDQIQHVFDEFYKADVSRHDFDSSGLGMPIAKRIVEKHGGRIWAESQGLGNGSTIYFSLPFQPTIVYDEDDSKGKDSQDIGSKVDLLLSK